MSNCITCYNPEFDKLIYGLKFTIDKLSSEIIKSKFYGFSCDKKAEDKLKTLFSYLRVIEEENRNVSLGGEPCLKSHKLQSLAEKIRGISVRCDYENRKDLISDRSNMDSWVAANPYCVSREKWERIAYQVCEAFRLEVTSIEEKCNLTFEVIRNIIPCDIILAVSVYEQMCDLNLHVDRDEVECQIDFDILSTETNCNIDFRTYKTLIDCNLSFDIIKTIYENDCQIEIGEDGIILVSALNSYNVNELKFGGIPDFTILKTLNVDTSNSEYLKDPKAFLNKLKQDYKHGK